MHEYHVFCCEKSHNWIVNDNEHTTYKPMGLFINRSDGFLFLLKLEDKHTRHNYNKDNDHNDDHMESRRSCWWKHTLGITLLSSNCFSVIIIVMQLMHVCCFLFVFNSHLINFSTEKSMYFYNSSFSWPWICMIFVYYTMAHHNDKKIR